MNRTVILGHYGVPAIVAGYKDETVALSGTDTNEQLKFFKAKKQKFISIYAKKPRIVVGKVETFKVNIKPSIGYHDAPLLAQQDAPLLAQQDAPLLAQQVALRGAQASGMSYGSGGYGLLGIGQANAAASLRPSLAQARQIQAALSRMSR